MNNKQYVWYASYGSNLRRERFLCYITGGTPIGSTRNEVGCRDKSLPVDDQPHKIHYPLYFAKNGSHWNNGGVCFLGLTKNTKEDTLSRKYLITKEQFIDVIKQENQKKQLEIDFEEVMKKGSKIISDGWYGNIIFLGHYQEYPIFTFTAIWDINDINPVKPSLEYLSTLMTGIKQIHDLSDTEIADYFITKKGVAGNYSYKELLGLIKKLNPPIVADVTTMIATNSLTMHQF